MKIQEIREIIKLVDGSSITEFKYEAEGVKIKLKKENGSASSAETAATPQSSAVAAAPVPQQAAPAPAAPKAPEAEGKSSEQTNEKDASSADMHKILSPMVGTFYQSPSPDEPAYMQVGTKVSAEQVVCIVEAMKLFNEIEAEVDGEIAEILVKDGQLVEYGQPLFLVKTN